MRTNGHRLVRVHLRLAALVGVVASLIAATSDAVAATSDAAQTGVWRNPYTVSDRGRTAGLELALGPRSYAVALWVIRGPAVPEILAEDVTGPGVWVAVRRPGTAAFGKPRRLSRDATSAHVAVADDGQTVAMWATSSGRLRTAFRQADSGWEPPTTVATSVSAGFDLAMAPNGLSVAAWRTDGHERGEVANVRVAVRAPAEGFGTPVTVASDPRVGVFGPDVSVASSGDVVIAWSGACPLDRPEDRARARVVRGLVSDGAATWRPAEKLARSKCPSAGIDADVASDGTTLIVLSGHLRAWDGIRASVARGTDPLPGARLISQRGELANFAHAAISRRGRAIVAWSTFHRGGSPRAVELSVSRAGRSFSAPRPISRRPVHLDALAMNARGDTVVVWQSLETWVLEARYKPVGRTLGPVEAVSRALPAEVLADTVAAIGARGRAGVAWSRPRPTRDPVGVLVTVRRRSPTGA